MPNSPSRLRPPTKLTHVVPKVTKADPPPKKRKIDETKSVVVSKTSTRSVSEKENKPLKSAKDNAVADKSSKKKRPAWDTKGRLQDMEELTSTLQHQVQSSNSVVQTITEKLQESEGRVKQLENFRSALENKVQVKEVESQSMGQEIVQLKHQIEMNKLKHQQELNEQTQKLKQEYDELHLKYDRLLKNNKALEEDLENKQDQIRQLKTSLSSQSTTIITLESDQRALKLRTQSLEESETGLKEAKTHLENELADARNIINQLEEQIFEGERVRKKLHNEILELKGNIRVFCRVRPILVNEKDKEPEIKNFVFPNTDRDIEVLQYNESVQDPSKVLSRSLPFQFDRVFQPSHGQDIVFGEISQLVQSALDGYRVCIFAYGATNSGKSYTMEGPRDNANDDTIGMIPRAMLQIYGTATEMKEKGWEYSMEVSYLEIYNEILRDLLGDGEEKKHDIKHVNGNTVVSGLSVVNVTDPSQVAKVIETARKNRAVGETQCNERSSRSHSVFTLKISGKNAATTEEVEGLLHLIDLAGSERLSHSGSTGDRLKETQAINKSLSSLGDVICALANKDAHIPYRNSKLTYLLQNSLGGNSKTLMFVNVSPLQANLQETICSLRFATKVNACEIGTAKRNVKQ